MTGRCVSQDKQNAILPDGIEVWHSVELPGLSSRYGVLHRGKNSGYQAINLAYLLGATVIILLGYDMRGSGHFFGHHPAPLRRCRDYSAFVARFRTIDPSQHGIRIINCTPDSGVDAFERAELADILRQEGITAP